MFWKPAARLLHHAEGDEDRGQHMGAIVIALVHVIDTWQRREIKHIVRDPSQFDSNSCKEEQAA